MRGGVGLGACTDASLWTADCTGALCPDDPACPVGTYATVDQNGCNTLPCVSLLATPSTATTISATGTTATSASTTTSGISAGVAALGLVAIFAIIMMSEG